MANAGGAWDNAQEVHRGGRTTVARDRRIRIKPPWSADTVGDPFKDTSGPAMNILLKVMTIVSLVFASAFV